MKVLRGKIVRINGELIVEHSPRNVYARDNTGEFHKTFYKYDIVDPFVEHNLKEGDEVEFVIETYVDIGGLFKFCNIIK